MSTRASNARHVRQRKLNTKQPLRIIREHEVEDLPDDSQQHIPQVETGVEKGEEIEFHLQAVIRDANAAALGAKAGKANFIPTPDATKALNIQYDRLYPKTFSQPATYIRFSSTVEDSVGTPYCVNEDDVAFLARLNDGKDVNGRDRKDKLSQCSEHVFEEVMSFFEETSQRIQPFATVDNAPVLSIEDMERATDESLSVDAHKWLKVIHQYWASKKVGRPLMPSIKVRVLDTTSEVDDADPYICFRRREVRQTRKTRGRDAQVVEKLKKLRLELEQGRQLLQLVVQREQLNKEQLEINRKVFEQRGQLKRVKVEKNIIGDKGDDEELLVNQKPVAKPKPRPDAVQQRPPTIRLRSGGDRQAQDNDLISLADIQEEAAALVQASIESRKKQHVQWNDRWIDRTWDPITPPPEDDAQMKWTSLLPEGANTYPTPPPSLPSHGSQDQDAGDVEMTDLPDEPRPKSEAEADVAARKPGPELILPMPGSWPSPEFEPSADPRQRESNPACRLRYGRGGRCFLEARRKRARGFISSGVVSDSDSDEDDGPQFWRVPERIIFDYRCHMNRSRTAEVPVDRTAEVRALIEAAVAARDHQRPQQHPQPQGLQHQASTDSGS